MKIRLAKDLETDSIVDGMGIRTVIWTQGCKHNCKGCHNPETHSFTDGFLVDTEEVINEIKKIKGQTGITFSGGDPMFQPNECNEIAKACKKMGYNIWCYSGFTIDRLLDMSNDNPIYREFLSNIDVLVDGPFILSQKSYDVKFRGSRNQRLIDVPRTLSTGTIILLEDNTEIKKTKKMYI